MIKDSGKGILLLIEKNGLGSTTLRFLKCIFSFY